VLSPTVRQHPHEPVFTVPAALLLEYLAAMAQGLTDEPDPFAEAVSLNKIHAMEYLTTDHGRGLNATTALGYRRHRDGTVEFFHERDPDHGWDPLPAAEYGWGADRERSNPPTA
jgi:hypothetical protein